MTRWRKPLEHIAAILEPDSDKTSATVQWEMTMLLDWMKQTYTEEGDTWVVDNILRYSKGFWRGLFTCYDEYHIPRTNNDLEQFFRQTKACHRRITGLRNWNTYIQRNGEMIVLVSDALKQKHMMARLCSVAYDSYKVRRAEWNSRLAEHVERRRYNRNPDGYLERLEQEWSQLFES